MQSKLCERCEEEIPSQRLKHNSRQQYCCRGCFAAASADIRRKNGYYQRLSRAGNSAQERIAAQTGERPGHEARVANGRASIGRLNAARQTKNASR